MEKIIITKPSNPAELKVEDKREHLVITVSDLSKVSDMYHTVEELYDHRMTNFLALCHQISLQPYEDEGRFGLWRSKTHSDGKPAYDGFFIMGIGKDEGKQISYHLPLSRWEEAGFVETLEVAPKWDGHTSADVLKRIKALYAAPQE